MRKIPTVFLRDPDDRAHVLPEVNPDCQWVIDGHGRATRKYDGTCVMLDQSGEWWARREVKPGKTPPARYVPVEFDQNTSKTMGWEPIGQSAFAKFHTEALRNAEICAALAPEDPPTFDAGTYELIGPKINGNPENLDSHGLLKHADATWIVVPDLSFDGIREAVLAAAKADGCEGIVWHHPDGRMAKIKARDFKAGA